MKKIIFPSILIFFLSCDPGLTLPGSEKPGFGGTITFTGKWPPVDSLKDLRIIASPIFPVDTTMTNLMFLVFNGIIQVYPPLNEASLPMNISTLDYEFNLPVGTYKYAAVFQRYSESLLAWKPVGVYTGGKPGFIPEPITIALGQFHQGIDISVDFNKLPPLPF